MANTSVECEMEALISMAEAAAMKEMDIFKDHEPRDVKAFAVAIA